MQPYRRCNNATLSTEVGEETLWVIFHPIFSDNFSSNRRSAWGTVRFIFIFSFILKRNESCGAAVKVPLARLIAVSRLVKSYCVAVKSHGVAVKSCFAAVKR